jgi:RimJ/RimL family protein N-acetyltransferase
MEIHPITLTGRVVRLEPLSEAHTPELTAAGLDERIWRYMRYGNITSEKQMRSWIEEILQAQYQGTDLPFAVVHLATGVAIGSTRYLNILHEHRALEIGGTWYAVAHQRTAVNTECKLMLLHHAFENLECVRVQFKTDLRNKRSQRALERIGAFKEGVLRNHMVLPNGFVRHSVFYSIIDSEWPNVKTLLEGMLGYSLPM